MTKGPRYELWEAPSGDVYVWDTHKDEPIKKFWDEAAACAALDDLNSLVLPFDGAENEQED